jgi:dihydrofolate synthase/folylpolyglutamate synthase
MEYAEALRRTYALASRGARLGLDRVRVAARALGSPQRRFPAVQIAGTNGKGTVASLIAHAARRAGLRVGLFTSPHLHRFAERFRIDGAQADEALLAEHLSRALALTEGPSAIPLTFFEIATLAACGAFAAQDVDLAVLEVGLGGRLDATSIAEPVACAVTSIGLDHTDVLGSTLPEIAGEKAAIARPGVPLVAGRMPAEALAEVERVARASGAPARFYDRDFTAVPELRPPWPGSHQRRNAAVALEVFESLAPRFPPLSREVFVESTPSAAWPGRYEVLADRGRRLILDGAHNLEAIAALSEALAERGDAPEAMIFGALRGKPVDAMLEVLAPRVSRIFLAPPPIDRAFDPSEYAVRWQARITPNVGRALEAVHGGTVLVTGSLFTVAEARRIALDEPADPQIGL